MENRSSTFEELANSITHGTGAVLSLAGLSVLVVFASIYGSASHIVGCAIFGTSLVMLYTASTLYHSFRTPRLKRIFKIIDHACIYVLIAGTYTPFTLVTLKGVWGWTLFGIVWGLTLIGITFKILFVYRFRIAATIAYLLMGWLAIFAVKPLIQHLPINGLAWLVAGGLAYSFGTIFYLWKRLPYNHAIWHLFVLLGSICHYFAVMFYVIPSMG